ncbi:hypothetical protein ABZX51_005714 [Aspergillus tubingensis]
MMLTSGMCLSFFGLSVALLYYVETRNWSIYSISHNFRRSVFCLFPCTLFLGTSQKYYIKSGTSHVKTYTQTFTRISIYTIKLRSRPSGAFLIGTSASPDIHLSTLAMRSD